MKNTNILGNKQVLSIMQISDVQKIFEDITGKQDINIAVNELMKDYILAKVFQLKVQNAQFEIKWGLNYNEFEQESSKWENASTYEIEQEYYNWGELITELEHFNKLAKQWI